MRRLTAPARVTRPLAYLPASEINITITYNAVLWQEKHFLSGMFYGNALNILRTSTMKNADSGRRSIASTIMAGGVPTGRTIT
jgi:hypothetical protein